MSLTDHKIRLCQLLQQAAIPIPAIVLADRLGLAGSRETRRRAIRKLIHAIRADGVKVVASHHGDHGGYWLTDDEVLWRDYLAGRAISAKRCLAESHKRKKASVELQRDQGLLFDLKEPRYA